MVKVKKKFFPQVAFLATLLSFLVVILGAYTRLKEAGLGCPDWPGCYGHLIVPQTQTAISYAQQLYPNQIIEPTKAWAEMIHRYFAGTLVLLILLLAFLGTRQRKNWLFRNSRGELCCIEPRRPAACPRDPSVTANSWIPRTSRGTTQDSTKISLLLIGCVIFQAMLGMWTVTWQLLPLVVMGHLLGGMTITTLLWWLTLDSNHLATPSDNKINFLKPWVLAGLIIVIVQIFLGGWTSANYSSIICPNFPYCQGSLFPKMDFAQAFNFLSPIGRNYQGGLLGVTARITIQMMHRYWAFITFCYISLLGCFILFSNKTYVLKNTAGMILLILGTQIYLGILNVTTLLYLPIALTHNAVALLLLLSMTTLLYQLVAQKQPYLKPVMSSPELINFSPNQSLSFISREPNKS